jgi:CRISPR-associated endonuclease/helicase Cas3
MVGLVIQHAVHISRRFRGLALPTRHESPGIFFWPLLAAREQSCLLSIRQMKGNPHRAVFVSVAGGYSPEAGPYPDATATLSDLTLELLAFDEGRFLTIHPFSDFNGRTIRLFLRELLRRLDFPRVILEPDTDAGRAAYFAALEAADRRDFQPLVSIWRDRLAHAETPEA